MPIPEDSVLSQPILAATWLKNKHRKEELNVHFVAVLDKATKEGFQIIFK